jgi:hypothetical protein
VLPVRPWLINEAIRPTDDLLYAPSLSCESGLHRGVTRGVGWMRANCSASSGAPRRLASSRFANPVMALGALAPESIRRPGGDAVRPHADRAGTFIGLTVSFPLPRPGRRTCPRRADRRGPAHRTALRMRSAVTKNGVQRPPACGVRTRDYRVRWRSSWAMSAERKGSKLR